MTDDGACRHLPLTLPAQTPCAADAATPQLGLRIVARDRADSGPRPLSLPVAAGTPECPDSPSPAPLRPLFR